jgi:hypothetical protein
MSCPSGEGRCYGEGAKLSHWASIILSVAVSLSRRSFEIGVFFGSQESGARSGSLDLVALISMTPDSRLPTPD